MAEAVVLTIAGSDCSAGAGLQADLKTFAAMGVYGCSAVTAITAQNYQQLSLVEPVSAGALIAQLNAVQEAFELSAIKLGMLATKDNAVAVKAFLLAQLSLAQSANKRPVPVVIDPVMKASVGGALFEMGAKDPNAAVAYYREHLLPLATVLTPNLAEAAALLACGIATTHDELEAQAQALLELGPKAVLIKGGHFDDARLSTDYLAESNHLLAESSDLLTTEPSGLAESSHIAVKAFSAARLKTVHGHGTGCTLASAVAAGLAQGLSVQQAVAAAKNYLQASLHGANRLALVPSNGPLHHFSQFW